MRDKKSPAQGRVFHFLLFYSQAVFRRRAKPKPASPKLRSISVPGSGTLMNNVSGKVEVVRPLSGVAYVKVSW